MNALSNVLFIGIMAKLVTMQDKDLKRFERDLKRFAKRAYPFATRATLNRTAFAARKASQAVIRQTMQTRTKGKLSATGSVMVERAKSLNVRRQIASVGSIAPYMLDQEFGFTNRSTGRHGVRMITTFASGEGLKTIPRRKVARKRRAIPNIKLQRRGGRNMSRKQRNFLMVRSVAKTSNPFVFLDLGKRKGIFEVLGTKDKPRPRMVADLSQRTRSIPAHPWLKPGVERAAKQLPKIYREELRKQIHRHKVFSTR